MTRADIDAILRRQRELVAMSTGMVERSADVLTRTDAVIRSTRSLIARRRAYRGAPAQ